MTASLTSFQSAAAHAKAWPFELARAVLARVDKRGGKGPVVFETGYGPSGLPHIGTFGEVVRTTMVRNAFRALTGDAIETVLLCVSDDMDGMRKVPENIPNPAQLQPFLQRPLTDVPDPFGLYPSFAHHNNARLRAFLDGFGFDYSFRSATALYRAGVYDAMLLKMLERYDAIMDVMLPTLGPERRETYSPFLPISPTSGRVLYVPMKAIDAKAGTITFEDEDGQDVTMPVTGGRTKLQWKPDFGMRWAALGVDFEMYGKDHLANGVVYSRICTALGAEPPVQFFYELFLDEQGEKISKTKGNGISVEQWLRYATPESLALYNFVKPKTAKKLYFDVIPKAVDEYFAHLEAFHRQNPIEQIDNPAWHIHAGAPPSASTPISFALLLNLVSAANAETTEQLWAFIGQYLPSAGPQTHPALDRLARYALRYYEDFVRPAKKFRAANAQEAAAMRDLADQLDRLPREADADSIQTLVYDIGKAHGFDPLRAWFQALYEVLLGQEQGPRFGSFVAIFGRDKTIELINDRLAS